MIIFNQHLASLDFENALLFVSKIKVEHAKEMEFSELNIFAFKIFAESMFIFNTPLIIVSILLLIIIYQFIVYTTKVNSIIKLQKRNQHIEMENEAYESLVCNLSHEIKEQLISVEIFLQKICNIDNQHQVLKENLQEQIVCTNQILYNIISLKKNEITNQNNTLNVAQLHILLDKILKDTSTKIKIKNLKVEILFQIDEGIVINLAPLKLYLLALNLLNNAIKYSPENETITICITNHRLSILDNGHGINDQLQNIGKAVVLSNNGTNEEKGNGIGLYLSNCMLKNTKAKLHFCNRKTNDGLSASIHWSN